MNPPVRMNFLPLAVFFEGKSQENSYELGDSDAVRELSREPAMFQIGLWGEVLIFGLANAKIRFGIRSF